MQPVPHPEYERAGLVRLCTVIIQTEPSRSRAGSAFSAALDPNRTTEMTITATDRRYRAANKYADSQRPLSGMAGC